MPLKIRNHQNRLRWDYLSRQVEPPEVKHGVRHQKSETQQQAEAKIILTHPSCKISKTKSSSSLSWRAADRSMNRPLPTTWRIESNAVPARALRFACSTRLEVHSVSPPPRWWCSKLACIFCHGKTTGKYEIGCQRRSRHSKSHETCVNCLELWAREVASSVDLRKKEGREWVPVLSMGYLHM